MAKSSNEGLWLQKKRWSRIKLSADGFNFLKVIEEMLICSPECSCTQNVAETFLNNINGLVVTTSIFYFTGIMTFEHDLLN